MEKPALLIFDVNDTLLDLSPVKSRVNELAGDLHAFKDWFSLLLHYSCVVHGFQQNHHARSFLQLRTGLKINALSFGLGANLDQYGPEKLFKPNYGIFAGWAFQ